MKYEYIIMGSDFIRMEYYTTPLKIEKKGRQKGRKYYEVIYYGHPELCKKIYLDD